MFQRDRQLDCTPLTLPTPISTHRLTKVAIHSLFLWVWRRGQRRIPPSVGSLGPLLGVCRVLPPSAALLLAVCLGVFFALFQQQSRLCPVVAYPSRSLFPPTPFPTWGVRPSLAEPTPLLLTDLLMPGSGVFFIHMTLAFGDQNKVISTRPLHLTLLFLTYEVPLPLL